MSLPEPSEEVLEAATIAAYENFSGNITGQDGPPQLRLGRIAWDATAKLPFVRAAWRSAIRAALVAALEKARELAPAEAKQKPEPIDLAKNAADAFRRGVGK